MADPTIDPVSAFMKLFITEVLGLSVVGDCIGTNLFNGIAPAGVKGTYAVFSIVPLQDTTGQARTSIQTRLLCDLKFVSKLPVDPKIPPALLAVFEHFRTANTFDTDDGYRISIRSERPIEFTETGSSADDRRAHRGRTFHAWITGTGD